MTYVNADEGLIAKEIGIERVKLSNREWIKDCLQSIEGWTDPNTVTGEDLRLRLEPIHGLPKHPGAWGALILSAYRKGLLKATGEYRAAKIVTSHARPVQVYWLTTSGVH